MENKPDYQQLAQDVIKDMPPSRIKLFALYRRQTVYNTVQEKYPDLTADDWANITNKLWDILHK